jgi:hypothetical protein
MRSSLLPSSRCFPRRAWSWRSSSDRLEDAATPLRFEAAQGRCLVEAPPGAFADFAARALLDHEDLRPILLRCAAGMFRRLQAAHDQA